jgi:hypothetical protein
MKCLALLFPDMELVVHVFNFQVPIELIHEPRVDVHCIEKAKPSILLKDLVDEIKWSNSNVRLQDSTLNYYGPGIDAFNSSNSFLPSPLAGATLRVGVEERHLKTCHKNIPKHARL